METEESKEAVLPADGSALILVGVQRDYLPGGSMAVSGGDAIVPALNRYLDLFRQLHLPIFATRAWRPADHGSFLAQGGKWPPHCVADTTGAEFAPGLDLPPDVRVISKATRPHEDAYSGFSGTDLDRQLRGLGVHSLYVGGLATDYCVLMTVLDALDREFRVYLLQDAVRPLNLHPDDGARAVQRMEEEGALLLDFSALAA